MSDGQDKSVSGDREEALPERKDRRPNPHAGHREKLRRRFLSEGLQSFEPHNALELLLFYAIPQRDTNELAHTLIDTFGSLSDVFNAPYEELVKVKGISENSAALICLIPQLMRMYARDLASKKKLRGRSDINSYIYSQLASEMVEKVLFVCMDNNGCMLSCDCVSSGDIDFTAINTRGIISLCMRSSATTAILAHNHPRGSSAPSMADISATRQLRVALSGIGVTLLDHIIVSSDNAYSMRSDKKYASIFSEM